MRNVLSMAILLCLSVLSFPASAADPSASLVDGLIAQEAGYVAVMDSSVHSEQGLAHPEGACSNILDEPMPGGGLTADRRRQNPRVAPVAFLTDPDDLVADRGGTGFI